MKNFSRRGFLKSIAALAVLPLAGKMPKVDEELPGEVDLGGLTSDVNIEDEAVEVNNDYGANDNPYHMDSKWVKAVWLTPEGNILDGDYNLIDEED